MVVEEAIHGQHGESSAAKSLKMNPKGVCNDGMKGKPKQVLFVI